MTTAELAAAIRKKFPGSYDGKSDEDLAGAWQKKYPGSYKTDDTVPDQYSGLDAAGQQSQMKSEEDDAFWNSWKDTASETAQGIGRGVKSMFDPNTYLEMGSMVRDTMVPTLEGVRRQADRGKGFVEMGSRILAGDPGAGGEAIGGLATQLIAPHILPRVPTAVTSIGEGMERMGRAARPTARSAAMGMGITGNPIPAAATAIAPELAVGGGKILKMTGRGAQAAVDRFTPSKFSERPLYEQMDSFPQERPSPILNRGGGPVASGVESEVAATPQRPLYQQMDDMGTAEPVRTRGGDPQVEPRAETQFEVDTLPDMPEGAPEQWRNAVSEWAPEPVIEEPPPLNGVEFDYSGLDDVMNTKLREATGADSIEVVDEMGPNASGDSSASQEAINRNASMQGKGQKYAVYDKAGRRRDILGVDGPDYVARPGETYGIEGPDGFQVLDDKGGRVGAGQPAASTPTAEVDTFDLGDINQPHAGSDLENALRKFDTLKAEMSPEATGQFMNADRQRSANILRTPLSEDAELVGQLRDEVGMKDTASRMRMPQSRVQALAPRPDGRGLPPAAQNRIKAKMATLTPEQQMEYLASSPNQLVEEFIRQQMGGR